jgi:hypothetical protein
VILVTAPRGSTRIYPCALADVSLRGALLSINHRLEPGEQGRCEWAVGARTFAVTLAVAWSSQGRAGVRVIAEERAQTAAWEELLESVRTALDAQRVAPQGIIPRTDIAAPADVTLRAERGAVPERAIVELPPGPTRRRDPRQG